MSEIVSISQAKTIMGKNFIGPDELKSLKQFDFMNDEEVPSIPFSEEVLENCKNDYILILGKAFFQDGIPVSIHSMKRIFGKDPEISEPCFYNQDWYDKEEFIYTPMKSEWLLIRINVYDKSRAVQPEDLMKDYSFPSAVSCAYSFFCAWLCLGIKLWYHDYVWCSDTDHNGDRIYVGKYNDVDGVNKNGFSIHRHLALRDCYACIDKL